MPNQEGTKDDDFVKHLKRFDNLNVYKVAAGAKSTFVCCEGEPSLLHDRYHHAHATCTECKVSPIVGILHFTVSKDKKFTYWCEECSKKVKLPNVCFAIKAQIPDMEEKDYPELSEDLVEEGEKMFVCDFLKTQQNTSKTAWYTSYSKMTESIDEFNLSERAFMTANSNDINPIVYVRVAKGCKPAKETPKLDINLYYSTQDVYGLRFMLYPDFQYAVNQQILEETKEQYTQLIDDLKKFDAKNDEDLYKFIEDYCYQNREI